MRCESASSNVAWRVAYSSGRTKSSRISFARGVCQEKALPELALSSIRRDMAAAVKDFVVEAVWKRVDGVMGISGKVAKP